MKDLGGWVFYDGGCAACRWLAAHLEAPLSRHGYAIASLDLPWVREVAGGACTLAVLGPDGVHRRGADALLHVVEFFPWSRPLAEAACVPLLRRPIRFAAAWLARHGKVA